MRTRVLFATIVVLLSLEGVAAAQSTGSGFFETSGTQILDLSGQPIILRGLGLGGWLMPEGYMLHFPGYGSPTSIRRDIEALIGAEDTDAFFDLYQQKYVAEKDVAAIAEWGFDHVRLPFHYNILYDRESGQFRESGFEIVDQFIEWCKKYGLYVILDMHAAPGGQNHLNISDSDGTARLWTQPEIYQPETIRIWEEIARRYANERWIIGYDLINEPVLPDGMPATHLRSLYERLAVAIRVIDPNHILFIEGNWFATDFTNLEPPVATNTVYAFHKYWNSTNIGTITYLLELSQRTNTPLWLGESGENSNEWFMEVVRMAENYGIGWNWWTHKKVETVTSPLSSQIKPGYQSLLDYWNGGGAVPPSDAAREALFEMAEGLDIDSCDFRPDVLAALLDPEYASKSKPRKELRIPGSINAVDFDIGANGVAYRDTDFKNESGSPGTANTGGQYRNEGTDIERSTDPSGVPFNVGWINDGEWLAYTVDVDHVDDYNIGIRVASPDGGGRIQVQIDGFPAIPSLEVPSTGGYQNWMTLSEENVSLPVGRHTMLVLFEKGGFNFISMSFEPVGGLDPNSEPFRLVDHYPNPVSNELRVRFDSDRPVSAELEVFDARGRFLDSSQASFQAGRHIMRFAFTEPLAAGVYLFQLKMHDAESEVFGRGTFVVVSP